MKHGRLLYLILMLVGTRVFSADVDRFKGMTTKAILEELMFNMQFLFCRVCVDLCVDEEAAQSTCNNDLDQVTIRNLEVDKLVVRSPPRHTGLECLDASDIDE